MKTVQRPKGPVSGSLPVFLTSEAGLTYQGVLAGLQRHLRMTKVDNAQSDEHKAGEKGTQSRLWRK